MFQTTYELKLIPTTQHLHINTHKVCAYKQTTAHSIELKNPTAFSNGIFVYVDFG